MDELLDLESGTKVDMVSAHGSVATMATRAAIARIVPSDVCDSPVDIVPKRAKTGEGSAVVEIATVFCPYLVILTTNINTLMRTVNVLRQSK